MQLHHLGLMLRQCLAGLLKISLQSLIFILCSLETIFQVVFQSLIISSSEWKFDNVSCSDGVDDLDHEDPILTTISLQHSLML